MYRRGRGDVEKGRRGIYLDSGPMLGGTKFVGYS
jgi:hypothetical protein